MEIDTPLEKMTTGKLNEDNYAIVPILRAGMGMVEGIINVIPNAKVGHIGLYRNEETLKPVEYYYKMPKGMTAPIIPLSPPPKTNLCPLFAISSPSLYPSSMYLDFIFLLPARFWIMKNV